MPIILALTLAGILAGCTVTSTAANPDCSKYPYLEACQEACEGN